jgi:DNA-binding MarR family transcriptional regulator
MGVKMAANDPGNGDVSLLISMLRFATLINRPMRDGVAIPGGISPNELKIVIALGGEGERAGHELADIFGIQPMNVSRALAALTERGWVEQVNDPANRRRKPHRLTEKGWAGYRALGPQIKAVAHFLFSTLAPNERAGMATVLDKLYHQLLEWDAEGAR